MQVRQFTQTQEFWFNESNRTRHISVKVTGNSKLTIECLVGDSWQLVDTLFYSGTHPLKITKNRLRLVPTGDVLYELPVDVGEVRE